MVENSVRPILAEFSSGGALVSRSVKICGMGEAMVEEALRDLFHGTNPSIGIYAHPGEVELRITASAPDSSTANDLIAPVISEIQSRIGMQIFSFENESLASAVLQKLRDRSQTLLVAESCTGGMLGEAITTVPGSSDVFLGGVITYSNELKKVLLGVEEQTLSDFGAVSEEVAREMVLGAKERSGADWAISITGVAGPDGGTDNKPVGLVYVGLAGPDVLEIVKHQFRGNREFVRRRSVVAALTMLWNSLSS
jgi:nicotinamide-nucleotide amidase